MARNRRQATRHGYVIIDKPVGWTSHDVVARARRIVQERRVGHAGTLDPAATGVLPLAVGLATRTIEYLASSDKAYRATIRFGVATDSADRDGDVVSTADVTSLTLEWILPCLARFQGDINQRPPAFSAIKVDGRRLYQLARKGEQIDIPERPVTVHALEVVSWRCPDLVVDVTCSKGTYIRSIARDLGAAVGPGAHLAALERTRTGPFTLDQAMKLGELERRMSDSEWETFALPPDSVLGMLPRVTLDSDDVLRWKQGKRWRIDDGSHPGGTIRAYDSHGRWIGIGEIDEQQVLRPTKVIPITVE